MIRQIAPFYDVSTSKLIDPRAAHFYISYDQSLCVAYQHWYLDTYVHLAQVQKTIIPRATPKIALVRRSAIVPHNLDGRDISLPGGSLEP